MRTSLVSRRGALQFIGGVLGGVITASAQDSTKQLGPPVSAHGARSRFESHVVRWRYKTPTEESSWTMTPSSLQYERHHAGIPEIDPATHQLLIIGLVDRPLKLPLADLMPEDAVIDAKTLALVKMPNRDGFASDPRPDVPLNRRP